LRKPRELGEMHGMTDTQYDIRVLAQAEYIEQESSPEANHYVFAYTIIIRNTGQVPARLLTRHWIITDANERVQEVHGEGVVGHQPHLAPGQEFQYSSAAVLPTPIGSMQGSYQMLADDGVAFDAAIPAFLLSVPRVLH
jgi:ApaG protein